MNDDLFDELLFEATIPDFCQYCHSAIDENGCDCDGATIERLEAESERLTAALRRLFTWANAYPLDIFPEPDLGQVAAVLKAAGLTLDAVSASNMRHVLDGVTDTLKEAGIGIEEIRP